MGSTLGVIGLLIAVAAVMEGLDAVSGGEVYLASVRGLAQAASQELLQSVAPPPVESSPVAPSLQQPSAEPLVQPAPPQPEPKRVEPVPAQPPQPFPSGFPGEEAEESRQDFVDPRELQQVLREIRDLQSQIKQVTKEVRKSALFAEDLAKLNGIAAEVAQSNTAIRSSVSAGASPREAIQDFHDNQYWDQVNAIRAKIQLPKEIKQIESTIRRLERTLKVKSIQNSGISVSALEAKLAEMKREIALVQGYLSAGNLEEAQEGMRSFHEGGHPGEIEGTIYRLRDIKQMLKRVKDEQVRAEVDKVLQEVIDVFNAGEYLDARETLDEYADDLQRLIQRFFMNQTLRGRNRVDSFNRIRSLDALIRAKLNEPDGDGRGQSQQPQQAPAPQQ